MTSPSAIRDAVQRGKREMQTDVESPLRRRLAARYASSWETLERELRFIDMGLASQRVGPWFDPQGRFTEYGMLAFKQQHLERLLSLIEVEYQRTANVALSDLTAAQRQAITTGRQTARNMGLEGSTGPALNVSAYESIIAATDATSPLRGVLDRYGTEARTAIEQHLIDGMVQGKGIDAIVSGIVAEIGRGVPAWKIANLARTESMRSYRASLFTSYQQMNVKRWTWVSALSTRTCLACLAMHGRTFPISQDFMEAHPSCRCSPAPYVEGIAGKSGDEWFRSQPADWQRQRLGQAYDLYASGTIDLSAFVGKRRSRTWGTSVTERSIRDVVEAAA